MIKNILVTGPPGCGKTTLIKEILKELKLDAGGFFTEEIRERGIRKGFKIITLDGKEGILAHVDIKSPYRISRYGVNIKDLEEIGVKSILKGIKENKIIIIDEIGKAEMLSKKFRETALMALNSQKKVLGTIKFTYDPFTDKIKKRSDTKIFYLTRENREKIKKEILWHFQSLQKKE
jgi:nucleoside-triphosphatase